MNSGTCFVDFGRNGKDHGFVAETSMKLFPMMSMLVLVIDLRHKCLSSVSAWMIVDCSTSVFQVPNIHGIIGTVKKIMSRIDWTELLVMGTSQHGLMIARWRISSQQLLII
jgi:hypothetical protein